MIDHFDRDGKPISLWTWVTLTNQPSYRYVAQDLAVSTIDTSHGYRIATIWMGYDPSDPLLELHPLEPRAETRYETAVFHCRQMALVKDERAVTEADARRQHDESVAWAADRLNGPTIVRLPVVPARPHTGWAGTRPARWGVCPACRRRQRLLVNGAVCAHGMSRGDDYAACLGSRLLPAIVMEPAELIKG